MENKYFFEKHIEFADLIISSFGDLIPIFETGKKPNPLMSAAVIFVINLLGQILELFPEVLFAQSEYKYTKNELLTSFSSLKSCWEPDGKNIGVFLDEWYSFRFWWDEFRKQNEIIMKNAQPFYMSLN